MPNSAGSATGQAAKVDLAPDKKSKVRDDLRKQTDVKRITNVNVDVSIGRPAPRDWSYYSVPTTIVEIVPEYRGYKYAYVEDRYVIVDPNTYEVVYVIDAGGNDSARASSSGRTCRASDPIPSSDKVLVLEQLRRSPKPGVSIDIGELKIGIGLPDRNMASEVPPEVASRVTTLQGCRYVVIKERVAIVDSDDKVISIIE